MHEVFSKFVRCQSAVIRERFTLEETDIRKCICVDVYSYFMIVLISLSFIPSLCCICVVFVLIGSLLTGSCRIYLV